MKIAVNTRLLLPHKLEGIGWFTHETFKRLSQNKQEVEWIFLFDRQYDPSFIFNSNVTPLVAPPQSRHPVLWYLWFEYSAKWMLKRSKADLFISPDGYLPLKSPCKTLNVIHDINFEHQPQNTPNLAGKYMRHFFPKFAKTATRIGTVSEYSKSDICKTYNINPSKIDVIYNGVGDFFKPLNSSKINKVRAELSRGLPYFVFIGALNPRKNIDGMLKAYELYRKAGGQALFLIVGEKMFWNEELNNVYSNHSYKKDILFTGRLEGAALNRVLASAQALTFVSHFEGFGIPILEAFKSKVPVITATNSSMPEVAGGAALLCDSKNTDQIFEAMQKTDHAAIREELITQGQKRAQNFSWDKSAEMMWSSIEKTLAQ